MKKIFDRIKLIVIVMVFIILCSNLKNFIMLMKKEVTTANNVKEAEKVTARNVEESEETKTEAEEDEEKKKDAEETEDGKVPVTVADIISGLGMTLNFTAFVNEFEIGSHMEGNIAVKKATVKDQFNYNEQIEKIYEGKQISILKTNKVNGVPEDGTFEFAVFKKIEENGKIDYERVNKAEKIEITTKDGIGKAIIDANNLSDDNTYYVLELDKKGNPITNGSTTEDGITVTYEENKKSGLDQSSKWYNTSYIEDFEKWENEGAAYKNSGKNPKLVIPRTLFDEMKVDGNKCLIHGNYIVMRGENNDKNFELIVFDENDGKNYTVTYKQEENNTAKYVLEEKDESVYEKIDFDSEFEKLNELSKKLYTGVKNSESVNVLNITYEGKAKDDNGNVTGLDNGSPNNEIDLGQYLNNGKYLVINVDMSSCKNGTEIDLQNTIKYLNDQENNKMPVSTRILWNFYNEKENKPFDGIIKFSKDSYKGTILAPSAELKVTATTDANIIVNKLSNPGGTINHTQFGATATIMETKCYNNKEKTKEYDGKVALKITKVESEDSDNVLQGAEFKVTIKDDNDETIYEEEKTTDSQGNITINDINIKSSNKSYSVKIEETKAPTGYESIEPIEFKVMTQVKDNKCILDSEQKTNIEGIDITEECINITIANTRKEYKHLDATMEITKLDSNNENIKLPNAEFDVTIKNGEKTLRNVTKEKTNTDGKLTISNIPINDENGTYDITVKETKAPDGYTGEREIKFQVKSTVKDDENIVLEQQSKLTKDNATITVTDDKISMVITNEKIYEETVNLNIKKIDADDDTKLLEGAKFNVKVTDADENVIKNQDGTTNDQGEITIDNITIKGKDKTYTVTITETEAPKGYSKASETQFNVHSKVEGDKLVLELLEENQPNNLSITVDDNNISLTIPNEKIRKSKVIVKYLEKVVNSNGEIEGIAIEGIEDDNITGYVSEKYNTSRKTIKNYIPTTPPQLPEGTENVVYVDGSKDSYDGVFTEEPLEIVYWYERVFNITTEIIPHKENRTNKETGQKEEKLVDGGDISGKDANPYETVVYNTNAEHEIVITPNENYIVKSIKLISTNRANENTESIIYGDGEVQNAEISYTQNPDGTITLSKFTNVQADKHVIVEFEPLEGTVIVHYYIDGTGEEFNNEPVKVPAEEKGKVVENQILTDLIGEPYTTSESKDVSHIYQLVNVSGSVSGEFGKDVVNVYYYYDFKGYNYRVEYYYDGEIDDEKTDTFTAKYGDKIIEYEDKVKTGYRLEKVEPTNDKGELELPITDNEESNVIKVYYVKDNFNYTVKYYYDGVIDPSKTDTLEAEYEQEISTYKEKLEPGYVKVEDENVPLKVSDDESKNVIRVYYRRQYNITTKVIEHTEEYSDGTVKEHIKGGKISGDSLASYEKVFKGEDSTGAIVIEPDNDYEIIKITLSDGDKENEVLDHSKLIKNDKVTIPAGYFTNMQSDKHIEVEFRKKTKVIVKYLEKTENGYTENKLLPQDEIPGYENKQYTTSRKDVLNYRAVEDPDNNIEPKNASGTMKADTIEVIYYYEKIPSGVTVKYLEKVTHPDGTIGAIKIPDADDEYIKGHVGEDYKTSRKEIENYVATEPPKLGETSKGVVYVDKDKENFDGKYTEGTIKIVYWYERQFHISTKVKPLPNANPDTEGGEQGNPSTNNGGHISGENDENIPYEDVPRSQENKKKVEIVPDDGYRVRDVVINGESTDVSKFEQEDGSIIIPEEYFKDVQEDIVIEVEFEHIPATLTVKYVDENTGEEIIPEEHTDGYVNDEYSTERKEIENYVSSGGDPENAKGKLVEEGVTVTYYYTRQFKITTDVIEHYEFENREVIKLPEDEDKDASTSYSQGGKILVKGGSISGEDEQPYELVNRGKDNTKEKQIVPDSGYMIKYIKIKQPGAEVEKLDLEELFAKQYGTDDKADSANGEDYNKDDDISKKLNRPITLEAGYFTDMQSDKHIEVEFERIPAKLTVDYVDKETEGRITKSETASGYINDKYVTEEKEIPYYEVIKDNYPENVEGKLEQGETKVTYWYRRLLFNMKMTKELASVQVNGKEVLDTNKKLIKVDIANTEIQNTNIIVKYKIKVSNTEEIAGTAKVLEQIPVGFMPSSQMKVIKAEDATSEQVDVWQEVGNNLELTTRELQPGETAEYDVILEWDTSKKIMGNLENIARITETQNIPNFEETDQEDNRDSCTVLIAVRTGGRTKAKVIISISCFILAGICTLVYIGTKVYYRRKNK